MRSWEIRHGQGTETQQSRSQKAEANETGSSRTRWYDARYFGLECGAEKEKLTINRAQS
jgi:hypothetical protein